MKHLFNYKSFYESNKPYLDTNASWHEKFDNIYNQYQKLKTNKKIDMRLAPHADFDEYGNFHVCGALGNNFLWFTSRTKGGGYVTDYDESEKEEDTNISKNQFDEYKKKAKEISDWLDEYDEKNFDKSDITIDATGVIKLDEDDLVIDQLNLMVEKKFKDLIGKEYEFEIFYYSCLSKNKMVPKVERYKFTLEKIEIYVSSFGVDTLQGVLLVKIPFDKEKYSLWIKSNTNYNYYDYVENDWVGNIMKQATDRKKVISITPFTEDMNRKDEREHLQNKKYPHVGPFMSVTPSEYKSTELIKDVTELLEEFNKQIK